MAMQALKADEMNDINIVTERILKRKHQGLLYARGQNRSQPRGRKRRRIPID